MMAAEARAAGARRRQALSDGLPEALRARLAASDYPIPPEMVREALREGGQGAAFVLIADMERLYREDWARVREQAVRGPAGSY